MAGAVSAAMLDAWLGTWSSSLNPLYEQGFHAGVAQQGVIRQVTWVSEDDEATCPDCQMLDGMTWVGDEIDSTMPHPGDSRFGGRTQCGPNCRCELQYEWVPADEADYSWGGWGDEPPVEDFSTADLLKIREILKYDESEPRDEAGRWTDDGGGSGASDVASGAKRLVDKATADEPRVTSTLTAITERYGGNLDYHLLGHGGTLDYRLKTEASTVEKINERMTNDHMTMEEAENSIHDSLRYTIVADQASWDKVVEGASVTLHEKGYTPAEAKDYWSMRSSGYAGFNTNWISPEGQVFELQFHTPESIAVKELVSHPLYEAMRDLSPSDPKYVELDTKINTAWASVRANPPDSFAMGVSEELLRIYGRPLT
jgi:hypothetical protein